MPDRPSTLSSEMDLRLAGGSQVIQSPLLSVPGFNRRSFTPGAYVQRSNAVVPQFEDKCRELAGHVLANQRGLNTPKCREELAACIQRAIENYLAFEKGKSRYS
jgi:hypothetical protein